MRTDYNSTEWTGHRTHGLSYAHREGSTATGPHTTGCWANPVHGSGVWVSTGATEWHERYGRVHPVTGE